MNAGTQQSRLNVNDVEPLKTRLTVQKVINGVPARNRKVVADRFRNGGLLTPKAFDEVIDLIVRRAPETAKSIERFTKTTRDRLSRLSGEAREALGQQKETVATAMSLAGVDRAPLREWALHEDAVPGSFLDGLSESRQREDEMIVRDLSLVPGYEFIRRVPNASAALFQDEETGNRLTVVLANRLPLEEQTGTDLIYYAALAVDLKHKLIAEQEVCNRALDMGLLAPTADAAMATLDVGSLVADRGYFKIEDIEACEKAGITSYAPKSIGGPTVARASSPRRRSATIRRRTPSSLSADRFFHPSTKASRATM